jgi:pimeloyl-ACP methyl ester carboxylesterase
MMSQETSAQPSGSRYKERIVPFTAGDGFPLNLINLQGDRPPTKGPVILVHGAGVRANIFRAPIQTGIVDLLIAAGYDVWLENWRACIDFKPNLWTLDQAAVYDHPHAVRTVAKETGADHLKAIIHCQGSTSFMMSAVAGLVPEVKTIVTNAVSLHPVVPWWSNAKLKVAVPILARITQWLNCQWGLEATTPLARFVQRWVNITHHECNNPVCKQVSFTYGAGFPALWRHENLDEGTHDWLKHEFAWVPLRFFQQISKCVSHGHLVSVEGLPGLPADFTAQAPRTDARFAFFAGENNRCFLPESQVRTHAFLDRLRPGYHTLNLIPGYSHLDVFMGNRAAREILPRMVAELDRTP